ncbi:MAG: HD domain-containing protein [Bacteroidales bacterium]|nr:HD domain-containing protein [Bacteroidales bacterium]
MTDKTYNGILAFLRDLIKDTPWEGNVFAVGGCCRDTVMGTLVKDVDLAVSLPDGGVEFACWLHKKGLTIGEPVLFTKYGTGRLTLKAFPDDEIELVQTRREKYDDRTKRDPSVAFGSIEEDCFRRDLTINTLYYDISTGKLLDITGKALHDIQHHIIRTPSDPDTTFDDDPVRILRAIRFAARYGWEIAPEAFEAMKRYVERLSIISPERMWGEFEKILLCPHPGQALAMLKEVGAMPYIIPELCKTYNLAQSDYHFGTVWEHTLKTVDLVPADTLLRTAALLHDIGKIVSATKGADGKPRFPRHDRRARSIVGLILNRLRCRSSFIDKVIFLVVNHEAAKGWGAHAQDMTDAQLRRLEFTCRTYGRFDRLLTLIDADNRAYAPAHCMPGQVKAIRQRAAELKADHTDGFSVRLPIKPSRIARIAGMRPGPQFDELMRRLFDHIFKKPHTSRDQVIHLIKKWKKQ